MNVNFKRAAAASVLCLVLGASAAASAQPAAPGGRPGGERGAERQKMFEEFRHRREQRLHDLLQIKPDQEGAFRAFLTAVQPKHRDGQRGPGGPGREAGKPPATTPERLDHMAARMAERQQRFAQIASATKAFYGALSPDQRKAFDAMPKMMGGRHGGHGGGHGGHHFGRPPEGPGGPGRGPGFGGPPPPR